MPRQMLTDEHWSKLKPILLQQGIHDKAELRTTVEGTLDRMRTDCQWRSLPAALVCKRFNAWSAAGKVITVFVSLWNIPRLSGYSSMSSMSRRAGTGVATKNAEAIDRSRAGNTSKTHHFIDAYGLPNAFRITRCVYDSTEAQELGYDSERICEQVEAKGNASRDSMKAQPKERK